MFRTSHLLMFASSFAICLVVSEARLSADIVHDISVAPITWSTQTWTYQFDSDGNKFGSELGNGVNDSGDLGISPTSRSFNLCATTNYFLAVDLDVLFSDDGAQVIHGDLVFDGDVVTPLPFDTVPKPSMIGFMMIAAFSFFAWFGPRKRVPFPA